MCLSYLETHQSIKLAATEIQQPPIISNRPRVRPSRAADHPSGRRWTTVLLLLSVLPTPPMDTRLPNDPMRQNALCSSCIAMHQSIAWIDELRPVGQEAIGCKTRHAPCVVWWRILPGLRSMFKQLQTRWMNDCVTWYHRTQLNHAPCCRTGLHLHHAASWHRDHPLHGVSGQV